MQHEWPTVSQDSPRGLARISLTPEPVPARWQLVVPSWRCLACRGAVVHTRLSVLSHFNVHQNTRSSWGIFNIHLTLSLAISYKRWQDYCWRRNSNARRHIKESTHRESCRQPLMNFTTADSPSVENSIKSRWNVAHLLAPKSHARASCHEPEYEQAYF